MNDSYSQIKIAHCLESQAESNIYFEIGSSYAIHKYNAHLSTMLLSPTTDVQASSKYSTIYNFALAVFSSANASSYASSKCCLKTFAVCGLLSFNLSIH